MHSSGLIGETLTILEKYLTVQLLYVKGSEYIPFFLEEEVGYPNPRKYWALKLCIVSVCITIFCREVKLPSSYKKQQQKKVAAC